MDDLKITVIGASGTGKSTLARALATELRCVHFDSDDYFHYPTDPPYQKQRSPEDRVNLLMKDLNKHSSWILSGGAGVWEPAPKVVYSLVVFLYLPPAIRLDRLRKREIQLYGPRIEDGGDMEKDHWDFMAWTIGYDDGSIEGTNTLPCHLSFLDQVKAPVLRLEQSMTTNEQINMVVRELSAHFLDNNEIKRNIAKQFAYLMDHNKYDEAADLMDPSCAYHYRGDVIQGVGPITKIYEDNFLSAKSHLDEIQFFSEVVPSGKPGIFILKYLDRIRKGTSWLEHRCEQVINVVENKVNKITHVDLPGESEKLKSWFEKMGVRR